MWKIDMSPDKNTPIVYEELFTRDKRKAAREKKYDQKNLERNKKIKSDQSQEEKTLCDSKTLEKCPMCNKMFKSELLPTHGQECAAQMFDR